MSIWRVNVDFDNFDDFSFKNIFLKNLFILFIMCLVNEICRHEARSGKTDILEKQILTSFLQYILAEKMLLLLSLRYSIKK